jgi:hypothetical protein
MLHYPMAIRADAAAAELPQVLSEMLDAPVENGDVTRGTLSVNIDDLEHPVSKEVFADILGVPATAGVDWWVDDKARDPADARILLAHTAPAFAARIDAEACLTYQLDQVVMRRRAGVLVLYSWFPEWHDPEIQAALPGPWEMTDDPGLL